MVLRALELLLKMGLDLADSYRDTPGNHLGKVRKKCGLSRQTCNSPMQGQKTGEDTENEIGRHQRETFS